MPWRFRRSAKILPGVRLNIGKSGSSVTVGGRGLKTTVGHGKVRQTVGIPGTGVSYTDTSSSTKKQKKLPFAVHSHFSYFPSLQSKESSIC